MIHNLSITLAAGFDPSDSGYLRGRYAFTRDGRRFILRTDESIELTTAILSQAGVAVQQPITEISEEEYFSIQGFVSENPDLIEA